MHTEKELKALRKGELKKLLQGMGVAFPESATNAEMIELIMAEEKKLAEPPAEVREIEISGTIGGTLTIKAKHKTGFYRCGRFWPHEGREIALSELSEKEVAALQAEKNLIVE